ncbi:hypothetical protein RND81_09G182800 [Saponaria officinalis]|uniref:BHLH domain-containing protein n=1 Tax=Saponaria officinalis TaxID=3572 RepID=A0AAW1INQ1_SAPOF
MNNTNFSGNNNIPPMPFFNDDFILQDIVDDHQSLNFDHVIEMIRGEAPNELSISVNNDHQPLNFNPHIFTTNVQCPPPLGADHVFSSFNSPTVSYTNNNNSLLNSLSGIDDEMVNDDGNEDDDDFGEADEHSSGKNATKKGNKVDRSRTLISERRRRGRMKEKLYALRALVPNITKMDKASIVGDAVLYLQDMQTKAKKLKSDIQDLESSFETATRCEAAFAVDTPTNTLPLPLIPVSKIIMQVEVINIEEKEYYVKIVSNRGHGVAACLYRALDSLRSFIIKSSNLTSLSDQFVLTFTLNVGKCMDDINLPNLKLWISGAFMTQGFEFRTFSCP